MSILDKVIDELLEADYYSIGHRDDGKPVWLWMWKNGKLHTHKTDGSENHTSIWGWEDKEVRWGGRFDPQTNQVSLANLRPSDNFREMPQIVYRNLYSAFGDDIEVIKVSYEL